MSKTTIWTLANSTVGYIHSTLQQREEFLVPAGSYVVSKIEITSIEEHVGNLTDANGKALPPLILATHWGLTSLGKAFISADTNSVPPK